MSHSGDLLLSMDGRTNGNNDNVRIHSQELLNALTKLNDLLGTTVVERLMDLLKNFASDT
jgi:hypothetical protein